MILSPGFACASFGKSALITVAIFAYPPVVWWSAISTIGIPELVICIEPKVIASEIISNFDDAGISKETNWKGGGSFVYCELMKWNEVFLEKINNAKNTDALIKVYSQIKEKAFLNYKFDIEKFEDKNMKDFKELKLEEQKEIIIKSLDLNSLYVN